VIADVAATFQRSQIHNIKLSMSNHCLGRFHYNQVYPPQEVVEQSRMSRYYLSKDKENTTGRRSQVRDLDSGEKFKTSTLGEIVSLENSIKNVIVVSSFHDSLEQVAVSLLNHAQQEDHALQVALFHHTNFVVSSELA
nr:hypothetical protein [Tanacetum cinerariifolium]